MNTKKVFISYSWSSSAHQEWVIDLAQRLVNDGIDVILDKWDLKLGHDKFAFMEKMVHADDVDRVLVILDKMYAEKANDRTGGVGTETLIISSKVYESTLQTKFIPVVARMDDEGNAPLPTYMSGRIYIDLSVLERYEEEYEKLLRDIYQRPSTAKPKLGVPPKYLFEDSPVTHKTSTLLRGFESKVDKHPGRINSLIKDFFDTFLSNLKDFELERTGSTYDELGKNIVDVINRYTPLRNDYIGFLIKVLKSGESFDETIFISFFESMSVMTMPDRESTRGLEFDHMKFIRHEIFLYTIGISLNKERYSLLEELLYGDYFFAEYYRSDNGPKKYGAFYFYSEAIDRYYKAYHNRQFYSCQADLMITRLSEEISKDNFVEGDLLCHYVAQIKGEEWFPITYVYRSEYSYFFPFFSRLISLRHFQKVKGILGIGTKEELVDKLNELENVNERGYSSSFHRLEKISNWVTIDKIGSSK